MKKAFLICPVRGHSREETRPVVRKLECQGWQVYWPPRDTDQNDDTGYQICSDNFDAILDADRVFIIWDGTSQGGLFDAGMTFALHKLTEKPITVLEIPGLLGSKSFQDMFTDWEKRCQ